MRRWVSLAAYLSLGAWLLAGEPLGAPLVRPATRVVEGVTIHAVSDEFWGSGWDLRSMYLVDGSGLSGEPPVHAQISLPGGNSWQTGAGDGKASISFDLQTLCELSQVHVWNLNFYPPYNGRGARQVTILTSTDGTGWTGAGTVDFSMATGANGDPGFDLAAAGWGVVRYVRFDILNNYNGWDNAGCVGLSEVRFIRKLSAAAAAQPTWTWASGGGGTGVFRVKLDDPDLSSGATLVTGWSWTAAVALTVGAHTLYVQEQDGAGGWSPAGSAVAVVPDLVPPTVTGLSDDDEPRRSKTWNWGATEAAISFRHGTDSDPEGVPSGDYDAVTTATQGGGDGLYYLHVQARDEAGNESAVVTVRAWLDNTAPVVTGLLDDPGPRLSKTWTWGAVDADPVLAYRYRIDQAPSGVPDSVYGGEVAASQGAVAGVWYLHVQARDRAGNESTVVSVSVVLGNTQPHRADQNGDWVIQLAPEVTRLIQFYNSGGYHCQPGTEDGYAPGVGARTGSPHPADQNGDWIIQLSPELTRLIQFYNSGGYHCEAGTEDGYAPGLDGRRATPRPAR